MLGRKMVEGFRAGVLALALMLGLFVVGPVAIQDATAATAAQVDPVDVAEDDDDGFDDWGLLGLLGLAGLAGLLKRPARAVVVDDRGRDGSVRR